MRSSQAVGACGARASEVWGSLGRGEKSRCNHDAIMIRLVSHHWNSVRSSAPDALVTGQYALTASERDAGHLSAAPR